jgi:hypothetical protein
MANVKTTTRTSSLIGKYFYREPYRSGDDTFAGKVISTEGTDDFLVRGVSYHPNTDIENNVERVVPTAWLRPAKLCSTFPEFLTLVAFPAYSLIPAILDWDEASIGTHTNFSQGKVAAYWAAYVEAKRRCVSEEAALAAALAASRAAA